MSNAVAKIEDPHLFEDPPNPKECNRNNKALVRYSAGTKGSVRQPAAKKGRKMK